MLQLNEILQKKEYEKRVSFHDKNKIKLYYLHYFFKLHFQSFDIFELQEQVQHFA